MDADAAAREVRPLTPADHAAAAALLTSAYPHRTPEPAGWGGALEPNDVRRWAANDPASPSGVLAAFLALWRVDRAKYRMDLVVAPQCRRRGLGKTLLEFLIARASAAGAATLQARAYHDRPDALRLLERRGFCETMRMVGLELDDVRAVSLAPLTTLNLTLTSRGMRVTTLAAEIDADPRCWEKLRDASTAARFGWPDPDPDPLERPSPAETVEAFRDGALRFRTIPEACFIASLHDRYAGYSALARRDEAGIEAGSGGTAVRPEYRGLGVATLLKARCIEWAQLHGV